MKENGGRKRMDIRRNREGLRNKKGNENEK